jgi:hypothetical protein
MRTPYAPTLSASILFHVQLYRFVFPQCQDPANRPNKRHWLLFVMMPANRLRARFAHSTSSSRKMSENERIDVIGVRTMADLAEKRPSDAQRSQFSLLRNARAVVAFGTLASWLEYSSDLRGFIRRDL